jgi:hypothetical protein
LQDGKDPVTTEEQGKGELTSMNFNFRFVAAVQLYSIQRYNDTMDKFSRCIILSERISTIW